MKSKHGCLIAVSLAIGLSGLSLLPSEVSIASGQYNHVHMADTAITLVDPELQSILQDERELYKWGSLFLDSVKYDNDPAADNEVACDGGTTTSKDCDYTILHLAAATPDGSNFLDKYASEIRRNCFSEFVPDLLGHSCLHH